MKATSPTHHARCGNPNRANGKRLGFSRANGAKPRQAVAAATAAMLQSTGLPVHVLSGVVGHAMQNASSGHTEGRGRSRTIAQAVTPRGIAHHSTIASASGRNVNG